MVIAYALETRHSVFVLIFALSCVLASVYGFLEGAWPFGIVEGIWSVVAAKRWWMGLAAPERTVVAAPSMAAEKRGIER